MMEPVRPGFVEALIDEMMAAFEDTVSSVQNISLGEADIAAINSMLSEWPRKGFRIHLGSFVWKMADPDEVNKDSFIASALAGGWVPFIAEGSALEFRILKEVVGEGLFGRPKVSYGVYVYRHGTGYALLVKRGGMLRALTSLSALSREMRS